VHTGIGLGAYFYRQIVSLVVLIVAHIGSKGFRYNRRKRI